jgi:hypothetical protein
MRVLNKGLKITVEEVEVLLDGAGSVLKISISIATRLCECSLVFLCFTPKSIEKGFRSIC